MGALPGRCDLPDGLTVRIVVQSRHRLLRDALAACLVNCPGFTVVGRVADHDELTELCRLRQPDVTLLDARGRLSEAIEASRELRGRFPALRAVVVYDQLAPDELAAARCAGVAALVPSSRGLEALLTTLRGRRPAPPRRSVPDGSALTDRQLEIVLLMGSGHSVPEIAAALGISPRTVENHKRRIYAKFDARGAAHAVSQAARLGLVSAPVAEHPTRSPRQRTSRSEPVDPAAPAERGSTRLVVLAGRRGPVLDRIAHLMAVDRLPFVVERGTGPMAEADWARRHCGPVTCVLIDPEPADWEAAAGLDASIVVVHGGPVDQTTLVEALDRGAAALVPAEQAPELLTSTLTMVAQGYAVLEAARVRHLQHAAGAPPSVPELSAREADILRSIAGGDSVRQTARGLGIAVKTVENTQARLFRKLGVRNRAAAVSAAYALGLSGLFGH